jgi:hypothetical protein
MAPAIFLKLKINEKIYVLHHESLRIYIKI